MSKIKKVLISIGAALVGIATFLAILFKSRANKQVEKNKTDIKNSKQNDPKRKDAINKADVQIQKNDKVIADANKTIEDNKINQANRDDAMAEGNAQIKKNKEAIDEADKILGDNNPSNK